MPIGAFKINGIAKFTVTAVAQVLRAKKGISAVGNAQVSTAQSKFGNSSALFDASADWLTATHTGDLNFGSSDFTVEFWMCPVTRASSYPQVYQNAPFATGAINITDRHNYNPNKLQVWVINALPADPILTSTTTIANNTWYHIAVVRSGSSWKLFVNGTSEATYTYAGNATSGTTSTVTAFANDIANSSVTQWNGYLDEIRISNTARYSSNFTPATTPFVNDSSTLLLIHADGTNASTFFEDDNGTRGPKRITGVSTAQVDTAQSKFGGSSLYLDGNWSTTNAMLNVGDSSSFPITSGNWTIECWIRLPATNLTGLILDFRGNANNFVLYHANTDLIFFAFGSARITASATLSANTWHHIAVSKSGSSTKMFKDGTQVGSTYTDNNTYTASGLGIGTSFLSSGGSSNYEGWIDEVRISDTARYTANFTAPTAPFVNDANTLFLSHMDGTDASTVFRDDVGVGRSQIGISALGNAQIDTAQSKFGGSSALFDGTDDRLEIKPTTTYDDFTVECWIRLANNSGTKNILSFGNESSGRVFFAVYNDRIYWDQYGVTSRYGDTSMIANTWYHLAWSRTGSTIKLFVNGVEQTMTTLGGSGVFPSGAVGNTNGIFVGTLSDGAIDFNGHIDEIRVSNSVRYTTGFTPSTTPFQNDSNTLLLMHMDGTDASTVFVDDNGVYPA